MKTKLAVLGGKFTTKISKLAGKGGGNIPGKIARKIDPSILRTLAAQVEHIIVITGTNGKTTTSNLLANILKEANEPIIHNAEGNNLITGITTSFIAKTNGASVIPAHYKYAVLEVDEGNVPLVLQEVRPSYMIVNNFFRDQLNRYGEIDTIVQKIKDAASISNVTLLLNGDDPFVMRIGLVDNPKIFFGLSKDAYAFDQYSMNESKFCPTCGKELVYSHVHYGQLGFYSCTCGFARPKATYEATNISDDMTFHVQGKPYQLGIGGSYNVYNALGAIACAKEMGISDDAITKGIKSYEATNGRMQSFAISGHERLLNLAKNQVGADISISEMVRDEHPKHIVYALNDLNHDSEDISWIWDADFERLTQANVTGITCTGTRAYDMALRIKYAGIPVDKIKVVPHLEEAVEEGLKHPMKTYFLPTYTALDPMRKLLEKR